MNIEILHIIILAITRILEMSASRFRRALNFDFWNSEGFKEFFKEFKELADKCGLIKKEKAKTVVKYIDKEIKKFWKRLEGYGENYRILKEKS